eukprot:1180451-Prorocentrum_minimum.AAC.2
MGSSNPNISLPIRVSPKVVGSRVVGEVHAGPRQYARSITRSESVQIGCPGMASSRTSSGHARFATTPCQHMASGSGKPHRQRQPRSAPAPAPAPRRIPLLWFPQPRGW